MKKLILITILFSGCYSKLYIDRQYEVVEYRHFYNNTCKSCHYNYFNQYNYKPIRYTYFLPNNIMRDYDRHKENYSKQKNKDNIDHKQQNRNTGSRRSN